MIIKHDYSSIIFNSRRLYKFQLPSQPFSFVFEFIPIAAAAAAGTRYSFRIIIMGFEGKFVLITG